MPSLVRAECAAKPSWSMESPRWQQVQYTPPNEDEDNHLWRSARAEGCTQRECAASMSPGARMLAAKGPKAATALLNTVTPPGPCPGLPAARGTSPGPGRRPRRGGRGATLRGLGVAVAMVGNRQGSRCRSRAASSRSRRKLARVERVYMPSMRCELHSSWMRLRSACRDFQPMPSMTAMTN